MSIRDTNTRSDAACRRRTSWLLVLTLTLLVRAGSAALADDRRCDSPLIVVWGQTWTLTDDLKVEQVIILPGGRLHTGSHTLMITGPGGLIVLGDGRLFVPDGGSLLLTGGGTSLVDGLVVLEGLGARVTIRANGHTLAGTGSIIGEHNLATIDDDPVDSAELTVAPGFTIEGALRICLDLVNNGTVRANDATMAGSRDRLTLDSGRFTGSGVFDVNTAGASLKFDATGVTATGLGADFTVSSGTLDIDENVCTAGDLTFTSGTIDVAAGKSFKAGGSCPLQRDRAAEVGAADARRYWSGRRPGRVNGTKRESRWLPVRAGTGSRLRAHNPAHCGQEHCPMKALNSSTKGITVQRRGMTAGRRPVSHAQGGFSPARTRAGRKPGSHGSSRAGQSPSSSTILARSRRSRSIASGAHRGRAHNVCTLNSSRSSAWHAARKASLSAALLTAGVSPIAASPVLGAHICRPLAGRTPGGKHLRGDKAEGEAPTGPAGEAHSHRQTDHGPPF